MCDPRYGWAEVCEARFGTHPVQVFHEWNTAVHRSDGEARPGGRPLSRDELQRFFDYCDDRVAVLERSGRKGWLAAYRDAVLFKTIYAWGLRLREAAMLDLADWGPNAKFARFGSYGVVRVRYGKASRGSPPRQRTVLSVMEWAASGVAEWVEDIRPAYEVGAAGDVVADRAGPAASTYRRSTPASRPTATGAGRTRSCGARTVCATRTRRIWPRAVGITCSSRSNSAHAWGSTTALYTSVSSAILNKTLQRACARVR